MLLTLLQHSRMLLRNELLKLKNTPVPYLVLLGALFTATIVFLSHLLDPHYLVRLNANPWDRYLEATISVFSIFLLCPFLILLISAVTFVEQQANAWKYLYSLPFRRGQFYFSKLLLLLLVLVFSLFFMQLSVIVSAYLLHFFRPSYEFIYHPPPLEEIFAYLRQLAIACLGILGFQYLLSLWFQRFLLPLGVGIFGFITSMLLTLSSSPYAQYSPYSHPMLVIDHQMFRNDFIIENTLGSLNNIECYSLAWFVVAVLLGYVLQVRRNVSY